VSGFAARRRTLTCRWEMTHAPVSMNMDTLGGCIDRPRERGHTPTFWPVPSRLTLQGVESAVHIGFEAPTAVSFSPDHALEWIVARNPVRERAFGVLPVLAHPIGGTVDERQTHTATLFASSGRGLGPCLRARLDAMWLPPAQRALKEQVLARVECDDPTVSVVAFKRADVGAGVIVRLAREASTPAIVRLGIASSLGTIWGAFRCDAREEDDEPLEIEAGRVVIPQRARLTSVRLIVR
jgi:hypothetical protein